MTIHDISELINDDYDKFLKFNEKTGNEMIEELTYHAFKDFVQEYREEMYGAITDLKKEDNIDVYYDEMLKPSYGLRDFYNTYVVNDSSNKVIVDEVYSERFDDIYNLSGIEYGKALESIVSDWRDSNYLVDADQILDMINDEIDELKENSFDYDYESNSVHSIPFDPSDRIFNTIEENVEDNIQGHLMSVKTWVSRFKNSPDTQLLSKVAGELGLKYDDETNKIIFNK